MTRFLGYSMDYGESELYFLSSSSSLQKHLSPPPFPLHKLNPILGDIDIFMAQEVYPFFVSNVKRLNPLAHLVRQVQLILLNNPPHFFFFFFADALIQSTTHPASLFLICGLLPRKLTFRS